LGPGSVVADLHELEVALRCLEQRSHLAALSEVPQKLRKEPNVGLRIQQVLIAQFLRKLVAHSLLEGRRARATLVHQLVIDHVACRALQILHLVGDHTAVEYLDESFLDFIETQRLAALAEQDERDRVALGIVHLGLHKVVVTAYIDIQALEAAVADNVRQDKHQRRLLVFGSLFGKLLDLNDAEQVAHQTSRLLREGIVEAEYVLADHLRVLKSWARVRVNAANMLREDPSLHLLLTSTALLFLETTLNIELVT